ncbi:MAG: TRAP transporter permease, partial [Deltaproteobacteria bacterium]
GPAKAAVLASGFTGMVSGSSIANIVTTGTFTIPLMKKVGYPATKAAAVEVAASTDGQIAPPIMGAAAFIIAEYVNVPYVAVVKAAAIPAFASYVALLYITHIEASKLGLRGLHKSELPRLKETLLSGLHFLIPIGILLHELIILRHSPDKSAFISILWLFGVIILKDIYDNLRSRGPIVSALKKSCFTIFDGMSSGARNMVSVAVACASAGIIVGVVNMGIGGMITQIVEQLSGGNIYLMLIITAIASLLIGMGLPTTATYIVMASLTAPIIVNVGGANGFIVPLMAAHLFCFYFGILADDTPPVGLASYAAAALAHSDPIPTGIQGFMYDIRTAIIPFMFIFNSDLILHNINSWPLGILIFVMACIGSCAFASATQGWFITKNKWYDVFPLLGVTIIMFRPGLLASLLSLPNKYLAYLAGLLLWAGIFYLQKFRTRSTATA